MITNGSAAKQSAVPLVQVDAFAREVFQGNPAAVCLLPEPAGETWMQRVAGEMNLAETAFLVGRSPGVYGLRWFTPLVEVDLCGHATLAGAHVLWEEGIEPGDAGLRFETRSGILRAVRDADWIELDFPAEPAAPAEPPRGLIEALGVTPRHVGRNRFDYLVEVDSEADLRAVAPDMAELGRIGGRGVIVTSRAAGVPAAGLPAGERFDFVSRFFAPAVGIDEDPVTGSAHCCLGPYWCARLGRKALTGYQASARGGVVRVRVAGDRVHLGGQAVTVFRTTLTTP